MGIITAGLTAIARAAGVVIRPVGQAAALTLKTARAHYGVGAEWFAAPGESNPPQVSEIGLIPNVALTVVGIVPASYVLAAGSSICFNSLATMTRSVIFITNHTVAADLEENLISPPKQPLTAKQNIFGAPGFVLAVPAGAAFGSLVVAGRVLSNSAKTAGHTADFLVDKALGTHDQPGRGHRSRNSVQKVLGIPGYPFGVGFAATYLVWINTKPMLSESAESFARAQREAANRLLGTSYKNDITHDARTGAQMARGIPGYLVGIPVALTVTAPLVSTLRVGRESLTSTFETYQVVTNPEFRPSQTNFERKGLGFVGWVIGGTTGQLSNGRIIHNSLISAERTFEIGIRPVDEHPSKLEPDERSLTEKYVKGMPGILIAVGGLVPAYYGLRVCKESIKGWAELSVSLLNMSSGIRFGRGLGRDVENNKHRRHPVANEIMRMPGYATTTITSMPIATVVLLARLSILLPVGAVGIVASPVVAGVKLARDESRFKNDNPDVVEQRFKNLNSSLTIMGKLRTGEIALKGDGARGFTAFAREAAFFNQSSMTEEVLDALWAGYQKASDQEKDEFFQHGNYRKALDPVLHRHFLETNDTCIRDIARFIKYYVRGDLQTAPDNLYTNHQDLSKLFWGDKPGRGERLKRPNYEPQADAGPVLH